MEKTSIIRFVTHFVLMFTLTSCSFSQKTTFVLKPIESEFIYSQKITTYNKDSINNFLNIMASNMNKPKAILKDLHLSVFQNPKEIDSIVTEHTYYLYNIQAIGAITNITVVGTNDDWVNEILMLSYDADGKLIIKNIMAQLGGDQEYFIESESTVINDSTYRKTTKEFEYSINSNSNELKNTKTEELNIPN